VTRVTGFFVLSLEEATGEGILENEI